MTIRLFRERSNEEIHGLPIRVHEDEPIVIEFLTDRNFRTRPAVLLDGQPIGAPDAHPEGDRLAWRWQFRSESWCGRAVLTLVSDSGSSEIQLTAVPNDTKYSEQEYDRMLDRVLSYASTLPFGLAPGERDAASASASQELSVTHPAVIHNYLGPLREQLRRVLADPVREQRRHEIYDKLAATRPLSPRTLTWLSSHPNQLAHVQLGSYDIECLQQIRLDTYDHPANRYLVTLLRRLRRSFESTAATLEGYAAKLDDGLEKNRASLFAGRARRAVHDLSRALRHPVLTNLQPAELTEGVAQVFADHPAYARFCKLASRLLDAAVALDSTGDLASSLRRSWDLFELYCLYRLIDVLESELDADWAFAHSGFHHHVLTMPVEGQCWQASHPDGRRLALFYQQQFGGASRSALTITTQRIPDFVLVAYDGAALRGWALLDAKYRTARPSIQEALESMHVYRDSLRWRCDITGAERPATAGFLFVPTIAPSSSRFGEPIFIRKQRFGLIAVDSSGVGDTILTALNFRDG